MFFHEKQKRKIRISAEDVVQLHDADVKWGRKAQTLSVGRWVD